ncbi:protein of unknown function [Paraburkholderia kururiensis]
MAVRRRASARFSIEWALTERRRYPTLEAGGIRGLNGRGAEEAVTRLADLLAGAGEASGAIGSNKVTAKNAVILAID